MWIKFVHNRAPQWLAMMRNWIAGNKGHPVLVIRYEDIKLNPVREVKKMLRFLNIEYDEHEVEERLQKDFSIYHREHKQSDNGLEEVVQISDDH